MLPGSQRTRWMPHLLRLVFLRRVRHCMEFLSTEIHTPCVLCRTGLSSILFLCLFYCVCFYDTVVILHPVSRSHNNNNSNNNKKQSSEHLLQTCNMLTYNTISCQVSVLWVKGTWMYLSLPDAVCLANMNGSRPDAVCLVNMNGLEDFLDTVLSYFSQCCNKMSHRKKGLFWLMVSGGFQSITAGKL